MQVLELQSKSTANTNLEYNTQESYPSAIYRPHNARNKNQWNCISNVIWIKNNKKVQLVYIT